MSKILIVEDDISIQALLHDFIQEAGHSVVLAADGVEALAKYSEQTFDLVLLDIMLPKIDGYGVCEVIRQKSNVPIIMLTALDNEENQIKGLDLQADDYITKPFSMPVLLRKIAAVLRRSSRQDDVPQTISYKDLILKHCFRIKLLNLQIVCPLKRLAYLMKSVALKSIMREQKLLNNQK